MSRPDRGGASYRAVLMLPHARNLFAAATLARLSYALPGIALLLALRHATGSYSLASATTGVFGLLSALLGPARARLVQRHHAVLPLLAVAYAVCLAALATACACGAPKALPMALTTVAGLFPPPVGPLMRTLWGTLAPDADHVRRALSLDAATESTVFALGPVAGGALAAVSAPGTLAGTAALVLVAFVLLVRALRRAPAGVARPGAAVRGTALRTAGFLPLLGLVAVIALAVCACEVGLLAARGTRVTGLLLALFSVGGVVGGLLHGRRPWPGSPERRPAVITAVGGACFAALALPCAVPVAALFVLAAGACADVLLITAYEFVDARLPAGLRTEAGAWVNAAWNVGGAFGPAVAGVLVDTRGPGTVFVVAALLVGLCAALTAAAQLRRVPATRGSSAA